MKSIEKSLTSFLNGTTPIIDVESIIAYARKSDDKANETIDILFCVINEDLNRYKGIKSLEKIRELLQCVSTVMLNADGVDRKIVARKSKSLNYKLEHLIESNKKIIVDLESANDEIEKTIETVLTVADQTEVEENKSYDVIDHIVDEIHSITLVEKAFDKRESLVNAKDKSGASLFQNIVVKYMNSIVRDNEEDQLYYSNLLSLIMSRKNFSLSEKDKRKCLEIINTGINKMSYNKKKKKSNTIHIGFLNNLVDSIKGEEKEVKIDELSKKYNISIYFDPKIISQVESVKTKVGTITDREVVDDYTITIDDVDVAEIDDALTCKKLENGNYLLGVHIASVLGYFPYNSEIVQEAINRNRSIYLPKKYQNVEGDYNRVIPIFPYSFSAEIGSLIPGESKLARSYFFEIDKNGNIVNEEFKKTIVRSDMKATYGQINDVLSRGSDNKELEYLVKCLYEVTEIIDKKYKVSDIYEKLKVSADDFSELPVGNIGSQKIINKIMMLTGNRVATFFAKNNYPCLYRVHEVHEGNVIKIQNMINDLNRNYGEQYEQLFSLLSGIYPKGKYDITGSHYGMGLEHYCHCTSGLRRAADIVVEHALEVCYDREPTDEDIINLQHEINSVVNRINSKQDPIDWFIKEYKIAYQKRRH